MRSDQPYKANFTKTSLIVPESRIVADLLLSDVSSEEWDRLIRQENILRKRTGNTAMTYASLARARLQTMTPELWELVRDGSMPVASQAVLAATLKFSPLFGNFLRTTLRDEFRRFSVTLEPRLWDQYIEDVQRAYPQMPAFTESTQGKLKQNAFRMLAEAGFIVDTRSMRLRKIQLEPAVLDYLRNHQEQYVLDCIQVSV